jgi:hypothetical protein
MEKVIEIKCKCGHKENSHFTWLDYGEYDYTCRNVTCKCKKFVKGRNNGN